MFNPLVSILIVSKNEGHYLKQTIDHIYSSNNNVNYEIIVVDDGSTDHSTKFIKNNSYKKVKLIETPGLGPAQARNRAAQWASGNYYVFADAHIIPPRNCLDQFCVHFGNPNVHSVVPVFGDFNPARPDLFGVLLDQNLQPYWTAKPINDFSPVPFGASGCFAIRSDIFEAAGAYDEGLRVTGYEDIDLSLRLWMLGYSIYLDPQIHVLHKFRKTKPYTAQPENALFNFLRVAFKLFNEQRIITAINYSRNHDYFASILMQVLSSDVGEQRIAFSNQRKHDDDWFFSHFEESFSQ